MSLRERFHPSFNIEPRTYENLVLDFAVERVSVEGVRHYKVTDAKGERTYPSVTTALGKSRFVPDLSGWVKTVGEARANEIKERAANYGSELHQRIEELCSTGFTQVFNPLTRAQLRAILPVIESIDTVYVQEKFLYSDSLKLAGTPDMVCSLKDKPGRWVLDWKTSGELKENMTAYHVQATCYAIMYAEHSGFPLEEMKNAIVLVTPDGRHVVEHSDPAQWAEYAKELNP